MRASEVTITAPGRIEVNSVPIPDPGAGEVRIRTSVCGISPGTELLAYRGELPEQDDADARLDPHAARPGHPMPTGYCLVGTVEDTGAGVDRSWIGRRAFAFHPHASHALVSADSIISLPDSVSDELATFIPNLETAIGIVMDARPVPGERVVVLGQGIVGLLVTSLLVRFPLALLATGDRIPKRRAWSSGAGAHIVVDPSSPTDRSRLDAVLAGEIAGADLVIELSGNPDALNDAISLAGYGGRVVAGSWYGNKPASLDLGGRFHRNRISLISSQVSTINPALSARWNKERRMQEVLRMLPELGLEHLITHRIPLDEAGRAFEMLDSRPEKALQVLLTCTS